MSKILEKIIKIPFLGGNVNTSLENFRVHIPERIFYEIRNPLYEGIIGPVGPNRGINIPSKLFLPFKRNYQ